MISPEDAVEFLTEAAAGWKPRRAMVVVCGGEQYVLVGRKNTLLSARVRRDGLVEVFSELGRDLFDPARADALSWLDEEEGGSTGNYV